MGAGIIDQQRQNNGYPALEEYLESIPEELNTTDKIITHCENTIDPQILKGLKRSNPKKAELSDLPMEIIEQLENEGVLRVPQNYQDILLKHKDQPQLKRRQPNIRFGSMQKRGSKPNILSPGRPSQESVPLQKLLKS